MGSFAWALCHLESGSAVRRKNWNEGLKLFLVTLSNGEKYLMYGYDIIEDKHMNRIESEDIFSTDWELASPASERKSL